MKGNWGNIIVGLALFVGTAVSVQNEGLCQDSEYTTTKGDSIVIIPGKTRLNHFPGIAAMGPKVDVVRMGVNRYARQAKGYSNKKMYTDVRKLAWGIKEDSEGPIGFVTDGDGYTNKKPMVVCDDDFCFPDEYALLIERNYAEVLLADRTTRECYRGRVYVMSTTDPDLLPDSVKSIDEDERWDSEKYVYSLDKGLERVIVYRFSKPANLKKDSEGFVYLWLSWQKKNTSGEAFADFEPVFSGELDKEFLLTPDPGSCK